MIKNAGKISKGDPICDWAKELNCEPQCGPNSHWEGCVDSCKDIKTCGTLSPVPKECSGDAEMTSMCVCNEGYVLSDDECVKEDQCGCNTEQGANIPLGSTFETCEEICTCTSVSQYLC